MVFWKISGGTEFNYFNLIHLVLGTKFGVSRLVLILEISEFIVFKLALLKTKYANYYGCLDLHSFEQKSQL